MLHFASFAVAIVAMFIWNQWQRENRPPHVLGSVLIIVGVALVFPWALQQFQSN